MLYTDYYDYRSSVDLNHDTGRCVQIWRQALSSETKGALWRVCLFSRLQPHGAVSVSPSSGSWRAAMRRPSITWDELLTPQSLSPGRSFIPPLPHKKKKNILKREPSHAWNLHVVRSAFSRRGSGLRPPESASSASQCLQNECEDAHFVPVVRFTHLSCVADRLLGLQQRLCNKLKSIFLNLFRHCSCCWDVFLYVCLQRTI